jgi:DNA-binding transcriptional MerR regulator
MAPPKSRSRQRLYRKRDIEFVWLLKKLLWEERYTIAGARQRIQELGIEGALALLGGEATDATTESAGSAIPRTQARSEATESAPSAPSACGSERESGHAWIDLEHELGELAGELASLRALLQESA